MPEPISPESAFAPPRRPSRRAASAFVAILMAVASVTALAQIAAAQGRPSAASVVNSSGDTRLMRPSALLTPLRPGEQIRAGDRVLTGEDGRVELRFMDGAVVAVQPRSDFKVDEFRYDRDGERSFLSLARGAIRTVTGAIGKRVHEDFRLKTPTATIGIRGTDFETIETFCGAAGCAPEQSPGLTVIVYKGRVAVSNDVGTTEVPEGSTLRVRARSEAPTFRGAPPAAPRVTPPAGGGRSGGGEPDGGGLRNDRSSGGAGAGGSGGGSGGQSGGKGGGQSGGGSGSGSVAGSGTGSGGATGSGSVATARVPAYEGRLLLQHVPVTY
jgi:hypothetical protein